MTAGGPPDPGGVRTGSSGSFQKTGSPVCSLGGYLSCRYTHPREMWHPSRSSVLARETSSFPKRDATSLVFLYGGNESAVVHDFKTRSAIEQRLLVYIRQKKLIL